MHISAESKPLFSYNESASQYTKGHSLYNCVK